MSFYGSHYKHTGVNLLGHSGRQKGPTWLVMFNPLLLTPRNQGSRRTSIAYNNHFASDLVMERFANSNAAHPKRSDIKPRLRQKPGHSFSNLITSTDTRTFPAHVRRDLPNGSKWLLHLCLWQWCDRTLSISSLYTTTSRRNTTAFLLQIR